MSLLEIIRSYGRKIRAVQPSDRKRVILNKTGAQRYESYGYDWHWLLRLHAEVEALAGTNSPSIDNMGFIELRYQQACDLRIREPTDPRIIDLVGPVGAPPCSQLTQHYLRSRIRLANSKPDWTPPLPRLLPLGSRASAKKREIL